MQLISVNTTLTNHKLDLANLIQRLSKEIAGLENLKKKKTQSPLQRKPKKKLKKVNETIFTMERNLFSLKKTDFEVIQTTSWAIEIEN